MWHLAFSISALIIDLGAMNFDYFQLCVYKLRLHLVSKFIYIMRITRDDKIIFSRKLSKIYMVFFQCRISRINAMKLCTLQITD